MVSLRSEQEWPKVDEQSGWLEETLHWRRLLFGAQRKRTKSEMTEAMSSELENKIPGVTWDFSQNIRDNVMEALSGVKGANSVKIFGPDLDQLERVATKTKNALQEVPGVENVGVYHIRGQSHLEFRVDPAKCEKWGVQTSEVNNVVASALGAVAQTRMVEGEKLFHIAIRWPKRLTNNEPSIRDIPFTVVNNPVLLPH